MNGKRQQFHANAPLFYNPYLGTNPNFLSSLAQCTPGRDPQLAGCKNFVPNSEIRNMSADVFHGQGGPGVRYIPMANSGANGAVSEGLNFVYNGDNYVSLNGQQFDIFGTIAPLKSGYDKPVCGRLGNITYANPTVAQTSGQIEWSNGACKGPPSVDKNLVYVGMDGGWQQKLGNK